MIFLQLPEKTDFPASVFDQNGLHIVNGPKEKCQYIAEQINGLFCWNVNGRPIIRKDYEIND